MNKVILAYSGSIDSTLCIHWLKEHHDLEVIALVADLGLGEDYVKMADRAINSGAYATHFEDLTDSFCQDYIKPALYANLNTHNGDPLATALGRPAMSRALVDLAHEQGANHIAIGCKPNSDDDARFKNLILALDPDIKILMPLGEWNLKTREQKLEYARKHNLILDLELSDDERSIDGNIWGHVTFRHSIDDTWASPSMSTYRITNSPKDVPATPDEIIIGFKSGVPISLNDKRMPLKEIVFELNKLGGRHCVGHVDLIGHKINGLKTRKIIENPAAVILLEAHQALESLTVDRPTLDFKINNIGNYCRIVAHGFWFTQYRECLDAFYKQTQTFVSGEIRLEIFHGHVTIKGRRSKHALTIETADLTGRGSYNLFRPSSPFKKRKN